MGLSSGESGPSYDVRQQSLVTTMLLLKKRHWFVVTEGEIVSSTNADSIREDNTTKAITSRIIEKQPRNDDSRCPLATTSLPQRLLRTVTFKRFDTSWGWFID